MLEYVCPRKQSAQQIRCIPSHDQGSRYSHVPTVFSRASRRRALRRPESLAFGLASTFLCGIGFSIIMPVLPFLVQPYVSDPAQQATVVTLLVSVYAACVFLVAPGLGALSDRFGRRPLLLVCLLAPPRATSCSASGARSACCSSAVSSKASRAAALAPFSRTSPTSRRATSARSTSDG
nr:MFS transporter [Eggerthella sinensis]